MSLTPEWAADVDRRLAQRGDDIMSLYEISERIDGKVDRLSDRMDTGFDRVDARIDRLAASTDARFDAVDTRIDRLATSTDARFDSLSGEMAGQRVLLEQILERLDRD